MHVLLFGGIPKVLLEDFFVLKSFSVGGWEVFLETT